MADDSTQKEATENLPRKKRFERTAGRIALRLIVTPLRLMPWGMAQAFGKLLGSLLYTALGRYRRVAHKNLTLVYGKEKSEAEITAMAKAVFRHFGQVATEFVKLPQLDRTSVDRLVTVEGEEYLKQAFEKGHGVLTISGHFGNWEMMGRWLGSHDVPLNVVARRANDPEADKLLRGTREGNGAQVFLRGAGSARAMLTCLKNNETVVILPDQNAAEIFVPFFGLPTGTADGPAIIHLRTGAPILFVWCVRTPDNRFRLIFEPPYSYAPTGNKKADAEVIMTEINARLEAQIRQYPTQWLWLHDRWKASPGVFAGGEEEARRMQMTPSAYRREVLAQNAANSPQTSAPTEPAE